MIINQSFCFSQQLLVIIQSWKVLEIVADMVIISNCALKKITMIEQAHPYVDKRKPDKVSSEN